ncbi:SRPBCC family protein [Microlunatus parietis]|uniref:Uncharacterized protein YndB with AHSA1/START domain n=1 Tax=Microlunatus parietis TaxID=682979 RepID=A0A7Y9I7Y8_9ACTN|nr:SRPBCC family protein [Microlunatus parietis]NYE71979.1 uncharacterized protein YndB with AHSA1/START domain [Microlunatus parietis]
MTQTLDHDHVEIMINARPDDVYALVADVTRMPEFSPEIIDCRWLDGATEPEVGARFVARNKVTRGPSWTNQPVLTVVEPGRRLAWARTEKFAGTVEWTFDFQPEGDGTRVIESYRVTEPITRFGWFIIGTLFGGKDRRADLRRGMEQTLDRLRRVAERSVSGAGVVTQLPVEEDHREDVEGGTDGR